ncbi:MAG: adenylyl-sulfate kinase [Terriglobales bacterium]
MSPTLTAPRPATASAATETAPAFTLWFTGLSGAGKTTIANLLAQRLVKSGRKVEVLDGDVVRTHLSKGLGFSREDRDTNIRRIGFVCQMLNRHGVVAVAAAISPFRSVRDEVRAQIPHFIEVHARCALDTLVQRDVKGLYAKALRGEIAQFTGVSDPYEEPLRPEASFDSGAEMPEASAERVWAVLVNLGLV